MPLLRAIVSLQDILNLAVALHLSALVRLRLDDKPLIATSVRRQERLANRVQLLAKGPLPDDRRYARVILRHKTGHAALVLGVGVLREPHSNGREIRAAF